MYMPMHVSGHACRNAYMPGINAVTPQCDELELELVQRSLAEAHMDMQVGIRVEGGARRPRQTSIGNRDHWQRNLEDHRWHHSLLALLCEIQPRHAAIHCS